MLWSGSVGGDAPGRPMQIKIYRSTDRGATWSYLSNCAAATVNRSAGGLWEPEFTIAANGSLVCFYSDETAPGFSQLIHQVTSTDGITWTAPVRTIASGVQADRPGMIVVRKLPSGRYFMTLELCGPAACTVFYKTSANGIDWGPSSNVGARVETADGKWFLHTPTNAWAAVPGTANGRIFVIGQILSSAGGVVAGNGQTMFYNDSADGSGPWRTMAAPVAVQSPPAASNFCQNYSSPLLPSADGRSVLELATDFDASVCKTYFATASAFANTGIMLSATPVTIASGQTGSSTVTFSPQGDYRGTVRLSASIPDFSGTASFASDTVTSSDGSTKAAQLTIVPGAVPAAAAPLTLAALGAGGVMLLLASAMRGLSVAALGAIALLLASCGTSDSRTAARPGASAPRTYTATIIATDTIDNRITASTTATITVN